MANHVTTNIVFTTISEEGKARLQELYRRLDGWENENVYSYNAVDLLGVPETDELDEEGNRTGPNTYSWNIEHVGAKWCNVEDAEENYLRLLSAWSMPVVLVEYIIDQIAEVDESVVADVYYEDEMPNFIGAAMYTADGEWSSEEYSDEELRNHLHRLIPEMAELWDEEQEEAKDEKYWDLFSDHAWETVEQILNDTIKEFHESYDEHMEYMKGIEE